MVEVDEIILPNGVELGCVASDVHELGDLDKATKPYADNYNVAVRFDDLAADDRPLLVVLLKKLAAKDDGEVVVLRDGMAVLAHWIPSPPSQGPDGSGVREPRDPHPPRGTSQLEVPLDE